MWSLKGPGDMLVVIDKEKEMSDYQYRNIEAPDQINSWTNQQVTELNPSKGDQPQLYNQLNGIKATIMLEELKSWEWAGAYLSHLKIEEIGWKPCINQARKFQLCWISQEGSDSGLWISQYPLYLTDKFSKWWQILLNGQKCSTGSSGRQRLPGALVISSACAGEESSINRFAMEAKHNWTYWTRNWRLNLITPGDDYTIADIAIWCH